MPCRGSRRPTTPARSRAANRHRRARDSRPRRCCNPAPMTRMRESRPECSGARLDDRRRLVQLAQRRQGLDRVTRQQRIDGPVERCDRHLVESQRARERMLAHRVDVARAAEQDPGLRAAQNLVARKAHDVDTESARVPVPRFPRATRAGADRRGCRCRDPRAAERRRRGRSPRASRPRLPRRSRAGQSYCGAP